MERLLRTTSGGFGPVHIKNVSVKSVNRNAAVSVKPPAGNFSDHHAAVSTEPQGGSQHWKGYRDCISTQSMLDNYTNFKKSNVPARMMQWIDGAWVELPSDALSLSKEAFASRVPMVEIEVDGNECIFDFFRMLMIDVASGLQRSIAWIDVSGACFFPKFFVDESIVDDEHINDADVDDETCVEIPKIEIEIKLDSSNVNNNSDNNNSGGRVNERNGDVGGGSGKRKSEDEDTAESSCNSGTDKRDNRSVRRRRLESWPNVRVVREDEKAYEVVKDLFMSGMKRIDPGVQITAVHQFNRAGPTEKARWEAFRKQMEMTQAARGKSNTVFAWHGTSRKGMSDILAHGFGCPSKVSGAQAHGVGVYFSPARLPQMSDVLAEADDNGEKHIVLCQVVLGNVEKIEAGSQQLYPSSVNFDNGMDDLRNPKWFVVWSTNMNTHIIPECVVSYKCSDRREGIMPGGEHLQWIPYGPKPEAAKMFFSRLGRLLPSQKVAELKDLCMKFKAGTMAKDLFIKQLRSVVGNEMLHSAISGIQGSH